MARAGDYNRAVQLECGSEQPRLQTRLSYKRAVFASDFAVSGLDFTFSNLFRIQFCCSMSAMCVNSTPTVPDNPNTG
eukprot:1276333-Rhodomonas_salina.1